MPVFKRGNEVAGARWAVRQLLRAKTLPEVAECLSNETAGALGLMAVMPIAVGAGMAEGAATAQVKPADLAAKTQAEYRALMNRYQMLDKQGEISDDPKVLDRLLGQQGRRFLVDVDAMLERLVDQFEERLVDPWALGSQPLAYRRALARGVAAFELRVEELQGMVKMSQGAVEHDRRGAVAALEAIGTDDAVAVAAAMRGRAPVRRTP